MRVVARCCLWGVQLVAKASFGGVHIVAGDCFRCVWVARCGNTAAWGATAWLPGLLKDISVREE